MNTKFDLAVIGAGSAGLVAATTAKRLGANVVLVEKQKTGGECLHTGCVPSKTLINSARVYHEMGEAGRFGLPENQSPVDFGRVMAHVRSVVDSIYAHESPQALRDMGIDVVQGAPTFLSSTSIQIGGNLFEAKKSILCTGSRPLIPPIEGLATVPYLTNETVWDLTLLPSSMLIIGGGPISMEMAQSFSRFGCKVTVVEMLDRVLPNEDEEISVALRELVSAEGVRCITSSEVVKIEGKDSGISVLITTASGIEVISVEALFVSIGRSPNVDGLGLKNAQVKFSRKGIEVDNFLQTSVPEIYACGDVVGPFRFTHTAGYQADVAVKNALLGNHLENDLAVLPWVTFCDPEVARVGLTEKEARQKHGDVKVLRVDAESVDRSKTESKTKGFVKVLLDANDKILGVHAIAPHSGEFIHEAALAMKHNLGIEAIGSLIHAYPTYSEMLKKSATRYLRSKETLLRSSN